MTGEMSKSEVTRDAYPIHFAIADALGGEVHPFDQYQGPYVAVPHKGRARPRRIWVSMICDNGARLYDEISDRQSSAFNPYAAAAQVNVVSMSLAINRWRKVRRS